MIGIINYGVGNIKSVENAVLYEKNENIVKLVNKPEDLKKCDKIILPGVGAFKDAINKITELGFDQALKEEKDKGKYILGICLGMQLLCSQSHEFGLHKGLNFIPGEVVNFELESNKMRIPHMGWNNVKFSRNDPIFNSIENNSDFYFVHSYYFKCENQDNILGTTDYGFNFTSVIKSNNVYGAQFHPEKSQNQGLTLIKNFINL